MKGSTSSRTLPTNIPHSAIRDHLTGILSTLCLNPLLFVSEADIHKLVMCELMKIDGLRPQDLYDTSCTIGTGSSGVSKQIYKSMLLHSEYGHKDISNARSDLVILNRTDVKKIDDPLDLKAGGKWLTPDYILEFGTEKSAGSHKDLKKHVKNDLKKISEAKKMGYLIHIQRNYHLSTGERHQKNIQKYKKYVKVIQKKIKKMRSKNALNINKTRVFFAVVDVGGTGRIVRGKVRLLLDPFTQPHLTAVNLKNLPQAIGSLL